MGLVRAGALLVAVAVVGLAFAADAILGGQPGFGPLQAVLLSFGVGLGIFALLPVAAMARLALAGIAVLVCLVGADIALRVFRADDLATIMQLHPRYLHALIPYSQRRYTRATINGGNSIPVKVNADGYRGRELSPKGAMRRVVVYGDSFVAAEFSRLEDTFVARLGGHLETALGESVEMVNAGVVGYGPDQILLRMEDELPVLEPDFVVVVLDAGNDYGELVRNKLFRLDKDGGLEAHAFEIASSQEMTFRQAQGPLLLRLLMKAMAALTVERLGPVEQTEADLARTTAEYEEYVVQGDPKVTALLADPYDADVSMRPGSDSARYKVALMDAVLGHIQQTAATASVPLFVVIVPSPFDLCPDYDSGHVNRERHPQYRPRALTDALAAILEKRNIPGLDLWLPFSARPDTNALYFHGGDDHWNDAGQNLAAEHAAALLVERGLIN